MDPNLEPSFEFYKPNSLGDSETRTSLEWTRLILQVALVLVTVSGNLLVIISTVVVKVRVRHPRNYLIVSVALADLLVGSFVLPLKIIVTENSDNWKSGRVTCYIWILDTLPPVPIS